MHGADREKPLTEAELAAMRERIDSALGMLGHLSGDTCERCDRRFVCPYVWDSYNRDGDCLWVK
jgi:hypothetical protein